MGVVVENIGTGIHVPAPDRDLVMQMGRRRTAGAARHGDDLTALDHVALLHPPVAEMGEGRGHLVAVVQAQHLAQPPVALQLDDAAVGGGRRRACQGDGEVQPLCIFFLPVKGSDR